MFLKDESLKVSNRKNTQSLDSGLQTTTTRGSRLRRSPLCSTAVFLKFEWASGPPGLLSGTQSVRPHSWRFRFSRSGAGPRIHFSHSFFSSGPHFESQCPTASFFLFNPHHLKVRMGLNYIGQYMRWRTAWLSCSE